MKLRDGIVGISRSACTEMFQSPEGESALSGNIKVSPMACPMPLWARTFAKGRKKLAIRKIVFSYYFLKLQNNNLHDNLFIPLLLHLPKAFHAKHPQESLSASEALKQTLCEKERT